MYRCFSQFLESRRYWGSQGAGILPIAIDTGKWLVALRSELVQEPNKWGVIGGKIDSVDYHDPQEAAKREFIEETGYAGPITLRKAFIYQSPEKRDGKPIFTYHNFIGEIKQGGWNPRKNWETSRFSWLTYDELIDLEPKHYGLKMLIRNSGDLIKSLSEQGVA